MNSQTLVKPLRAVTYCRVSKEEQAQPGHHSLEHQLKILIEFAESKGFKLVKNYSEVHSGGDTNRERFQEMLKDAKKGLFDILLFEDVSRISREVGIALDVYRELKKLGITIGVYMMGSLIDTPSNLLVYSNLAATSVFQLQEIGEKSKIALRELKKEGKLVGKKHAFLKPNLDGFEHFESKESEDIVKQILKLSERKNESTIVREFELPRGKVRGVLRNKELYQKILQRDTI